MPAQGSGKTFTMRAVMRQAAHEIFQHIAQNPDREFVLRMSAMEVYNEVCEIWGVQRPRDLGHAGL